MCAVNGTIIHDEVISRRRRGSGKKSPLFRLGSQEPNNPLLSFVVVRLMAILCVITSEGEKPCR